MGSDVFSVLGMKVGKIKKSRRIGNQFRAE